MPKPHRKPKSSRRTAPTPRSTSTALILPVLAKGEHWAGVVLDDAGKPAHHLILLPGELDAVDWNAALAWAKKQGGDLPSRSEQAILFGNLKKHFQQFTYWSNTQCAGDAGYAWYQDFRDGRQYYYVKDGKLRARAVRRASI